MQLGGDLNALNDSGAVLTKPSPSESASIVGQAVAVTVEPPGGSSAPTGDILLQGALR